MDFEFLDYPIMYDRRLVGCLSVIQALQTPREEHQVTTYPFTTDQIWHLLNFAEETRLFDIRAKFWFEEASSQIVITNPTRAIHETLIGDLVLMMQRYIINLPIPRRKLFLRVSRHTSVYDIPQVLDFQLRLSNLKQLTRMELWIGECGYRSTRSWMKKKLEVLAKEKQSVQFAFIIDIDEEPYRPPPEESKVARRLRAQRMLEFEEFLPGSEDPHDRGVAVAHGWTWTSLKEIGYTLCLRSPSGIFEFDGPDSEYTAHGTLFPSIDVSRVDQLLEIARVQLNSTFANHLQSQNVVDASVIEKVQSYSRPFEHSWEDIRACALAAWRNTAHERYMSWYGQQTDILL